MVDTAQNETSRLENFTAALAAAAHIYVWVPYMWSREGRGSWVPTLMHFVIEVTNAGGGFGGVPRWTTNRTGDNGDNDELTIWIGGRDPDSRCDDPATGELKTRRRHNRELMAITRAEQRAAEMVPVSKFVNLIKQVEGLTWDCIGTHPTDSVRYCIKTESQVNTGSHDGKYLALWSSDRELMTERELGVARDAVSAYELGLAQGRKNNLDSGQIQV